MPVRTSDVARGPIAVALSGGVDSVVAAARLVSAGHTVIGLTARLQTSPAADEALACAAQACARLRIPHHVCDLTDGFAREVIQAFLDAYGAGLTPNPCLRCNPRVKFGLLLAAARAMGCRTLATGHYVISGERNGHPGLRRAVDASKDQSYMLMGLTQGHLAAAMFPLAASLKTDVLAEARRLALPHLERPSQDVCFIAGPVQDYLARFLQLEAGPIVDLSGRRLGTHRGLPLYTVGQRKGLGVGGADSRLHVVRKLPGENALVVGPRNALCRREFEVNAANWVSIAAPVEGERLRCQVMVRYRGRMIAGEVTVLGAGRCRVQVSPHEQAVAPGQGAAFYDDDGWLLGGGTLSPDAE
jgi:tRNA-specific 2-thiouridylase